MFLALRVKRSGLAASLHNIEQQRWRVKRWFKMMTFKIVFTLYCNFSGTYTGQHKFNFNSNIPNLPSQRLYKVSPSCSLSSHPTPPGVPNLTSPNSIVIQLQLLDSGHWFDTIFSNRAETSWKSRLGMKNTTVYILCFISCTSCSINIYISKTMLCVQFYSGIL